VADKDQPDSTRLEAARVAQLALGDVGGGAGLDEVFEGYSGPVTHEPWDSATATALAELACAYPTGNDEVDRELGRSLALARVPDRELLGRVLDRITPASHPVEDIHQLIVAACLPVDRSAAQRETIAATLLHLDPKIRELRLNQDLHWDTKVGELAARLMELDEELPAAMVARPEFGRPGSLLFFREMAGATRAAALEKIVASVRADEAYPWSSDLVFALAESPAAEHRDLVRAKVDDPRIRGAVLIGLARQPQAADRPLFVAGLDFAVAEVLESCLRALATLPASDEAREQAVLVRLIRRLGSDKRDAQLRDMAVRLLARTAGRDFGYEYDSQRPQPEAVARWTRWLTEKHPELAAELLSPAPSSTVNVAALLEAVDWASGIALRGENLFAARSCADCHQGRSALGPDLAGVAKRFSRNDLLTAVLDPSRDVSTRYATTAIATTSGKTYTGLVIYDSVDGITLRDSMNRTIRIEADEIESRSTSSASLMPTGLLEGLTQQDWADLFAYLSEL
jgi:putative heme-binding domain-containing protein